jgi:UDP-N-acetylmuramate dehydrogenase
MNSTMKIEENKNLQPLHTMACPSVAQFYGEAKNQTDLIALLEWAEQHNHTIHILGEGSNTVCAPLVEGLVIRYLPNAVEIITETSNTVVLSVEAGKNWHELVEYCCDEHYWGIENLALIPGCVGAAPIQNIGAYGVEFKDVCESVQIFDLITKESFELKTDECEFEYRNSVFKRHSNWLVTSVIITVSKKELAQLEYGPLVKLKNVDDLTPIKVMNMVIETRQQKLPDPNELPNSGSFFHNPIVSAFEHKHLKMHFSALVSFGHGEHYKIAAGWLIDQAGLKGKTLDAGMVVYQQQALVLTNPNGVDLEALLLSAKQVSDCVFSKFGIKLNREPLILGSILSLKND